jgi:arylsulfatase
VRSYTSAQGDTPGTFYATDVFADYSLDFIGQARQEERPFFLYLAFNAPHFPLHAPEEDIVRYERMYFEKGWDAIREDRLARQKELGLLPHDLDLTPRGPVPAKSHARPSPYAGRDNPLWSSFSEERRRDLARRMAVFAAMVDRLDQAIGRVVEDLRRHEQLDNTLILFLSDNGACWEWDPLGFDVSSSPQNILHTGDNLRTVGGPESYISYGSAWANAGNTPWRLYKHFSHEGGIRAPLIVHWPAGLKARGELRTQVGHIIDIMPTLAEVAGATYPAERNGVKVQPMEGCSLLPALENKPLARSAPLFFEHEGSRAVRDGKWKLVSLSGDAWELYDLDADPTEMHNLMAKRPRRAREMIAAWEAWAKRCHVDTTTDPLGLSAGKDRAVGPASPQIANRELVIRCKVRPESRNGVILAQGGRQYGYSLHLVAGRPAFSVRIGERLFTIEASEVPAGQFSLEARLAKDGAMSLTLDGRPVAEGKASGLIPVQPVDELSVGEDSRTAVGDYAAPNRLQGTVQDVEVIAQ